MKFAKILIFSILFSVGAATSANECTIAVTGEKSEATLNEAREMLKSEFERMEKSMYEANLSGKDMQFDFDSLTTFVEQYLGYTGVNLQRNGTQIRILGEGTHQLNVAVRQLERKLPNLKVVYDAADLSESVSTGLWNHETLTLTISSASVLIMSMQEPTTLHEIQHFHTFLKLLERIADPLFGEVRAIIDRNDDVFDFSFRNAYSTFLALDELRTFETTMLASLRGLRSIPQMTRKEFKRMLNSFNIGMKASGNAGASAYFLLRTLQSEPGFRKIIGYAWDPQTKVVVATINLMGQARDKMQIHLEFKFPLLELDKMSDLPSSIKNSQARDAAYEHAEDLIEKQVLWLLAKSVQMNLRFREMSAVVGLDGPKIYAENILERVWNSAVGNQPAEIPQNIPIYARIRDPQIPGSIEMVPGIENFTFDADNIEMNLKP